MPGRKASKSELEKKLLKKLKEGYLNGTVGTIRVYKGYIDIICGKYIDKGIPVVYRKGKTVEEKRFETEEEKLCFLKSYGGLMDDEDVREYSISMIYKK